MYVATFGKRGLVNTAPEWPRREQSISFERSPGSAGAQGPSAEELERLRYWKRVSFLAPLAHFGLASVIGIILMSAPFLFVILAMLPGMFYVGNVLLLIFFMVVSTLKLATIYGKFVVARHETRYPSPVKAYMWKHPSVYVLGTLFAVIWFGWFSGHQLSDLYAEFSVQKMLSLNVHSYGEHDPWGDFWGYLGMAWLSLGALFFFLDKYLGDRVRES